MENTVFTPLCHFDNCVNMEGSLHKQESTDLSMDLAPDRNAENVDEVDPTSSPFPGQGTRPNLSGFPACMWPICPPGGSVQ